MPGYPDEDHDRVPGPYSDTSAPRPRASQKLQETRFDREFRAARQNLAEAVGSDDEAGKLVFELVSAFAEHERHRLHGDEGQNDSAYKARMEMARDLERILSSRLRTDADEERGWGRI